MTKVNKMKKTILRLAAVLPALLICTVLLSSAAYAQGVPLFISGHVTVNGAAAQGASVSAGGSHATTDGSGYYQLTPSVSNGSGVTVTADYQGHQQSSSVTQSMQGSATVDFSITYSTATPTPAPTPTSTPAPTPTPAPTTSPSGSGGSSGVTVPTIVPATAANLTTNATGHVPANASVNATVSPAGTNTTATPTATYVVHPAPDQAATAVPAPAAALPGWLSSALPFLALILLLAVVGATGYYLGTKRKR